MKILKRVVYGFAGLIVSIGIVVFVYLMHLAPQYEGVLQLKGIQDSVEVVFDEYGIPHIYGKNEEDIFFALGYVQAQERLWQMELIRRVSVGRLAEILGKDLLETDKFFRTLGLDIYARESARNLSQNKESPVFKNTQAYLDGINSFQEQGSTPLEFTLLGIKKTPFVLEDVYSVVGYMSFDFSMAPDTDPLMTFIYEELGKTYLQDVPLAIPIDTEWIKHHRVKDSMRHIFRNQIENQIEKIHTTLPIPSFKGSNSWVIGGKKTKSGKVILANDPHIGFGQPCTWYEAYLECPSFQIYGNFLSGFPFPLIGHNTRIATGLTMLENDDMDFFREIINPTDSLSYLYKGKWLPLVQRSEIIQIKDTEPDTIQIRATHHGSIVTSFLKNMTNAPISFWWAYTHLPNKILEASYGLAHVKNLADVEKHAAMIHAAGLNITYGDSSGNYAWYSAAQLVKRNKESLPILFLNGSDGEDENTEFYPFTDNPHSINPPWNYVYSANNQPESHNGEYHWGYYIPEDRAKRIVALLDNKNDWDREAVKQMMLDQTSPVAKDMIQNLLPFIASTTNPMEMKAKAILENWEGDFAPLSPAPTLYTKWMYNLYSLTMEDELGYDKFAVFMKTHIRLYMMNQLLKNSASPWWDDVITQDIQETEEAIIQKAFQVTLLELESQFQTDIANWHWETVHPLSLNHLFASQPLIGKILNVGTFFIGSGEEVINNMAYTPNKEGIYAVAFGPSARRIIDFSDIENSMSVLPTGQSGVISSPHYSDQTSLYINGKWRKMIMKKENILHKRVLFIQAK